MVMSDVGTTAGDAATMGRPRHRLFVGFDDPAAGLAVAEELHSKETANDGVVILVGEEGARWLDVTGRYEGIRGRIIRLVEHALSSDIDYLKELQALLESGGLVLVVPVASAQAAHTLAGTLRERSGQLLAYFASWGFQPVSPE